MSFKKALLIVICFGSLKQTHAQYINLGYTISMNKYVQSGMDNLSTKFNLGWDLDSSSLGIRIDFKPSGDEYDVKNKMNWNRSSTGFTLGANTDPMNDVSWEFNFTGQTNKESGKRTNLTTGVEEKFGLKTKFGGINCIVGLNPNEYISFNFGMGVHLLRTKYSWESGIQSIKNQTMGLRVNPFSQEIKDGDRNLTLTFPVGATFKLLEVSDISLHARVHYNFVWNDFLKTTFLFYMPNRYNMNNLSLTLFAAYNF